MFDLPLCCQPSITARTLLGGLVDLSDIVEVLKNLEYGIYKMKQDPDGWEQFVVKSGHDDIMRVAELIQWEEKTDLSPWYGAGFGIFLSYENRSELGKLYFRE